ncbi:MAG: M20 family metallopeptidase [Gemmatimonadota bacterium]
MSAGDGPAFADPGLLESARARADAHLELLESLVAAESPSGDEERIRAVAAILGRECDARGGRVERIDAPGAGVHLVARFGDERGSRKPLLVLGHMDTVHPVGTLGIMPFEVADDRLGGPGVYDMKGGLACVLAGLDLLGERGVELPGKVVLLVTCDEEVGSTTSRPLIEELAARSRAALVPEPCVPGGRVKTRRKGQAGYRLAVEGVAAHAGIEPQKGASAIEEVARQILRVGELADPEIGTTVSVGIVEGGSRPNVVAASASCRVDVRFWTREEAERVDSAFRGLEAHHPRCRLSVEGGVNRYPLERTPDSARLFDVAREEAAALGFELGEGGSGGASDGNLTSGVGCPTLDGLGPDGGGAHSADEHVLVEDLPRRAALMAALLARL